MGRNESVGGLENVSLPRISKFVNGLDSVSSYVRKRTLRMGVLNDLDQPGCGFGGFRLNEPL